MSLQNSTTPRVLATMLVEAYVDSVANREARAADRTFLADVDAQILDLERAILRLRAAKELAQARLDAFRYPVLTLPTEIISEIFTQFLPPYPLCPPLVGLSSPALLTRVCRRWRKIALGTPALWKAVDLHLDDGGIVVYAQVHMANIWSERSRSRPMSMQIRSEYHDSEVSSLIETVVFHRARWEHLSMALERIPKKRDLRDLSGPMPLLRSLLFKVEELGSSSVAVSWLDAPLLRSATLDDVTAKVVRLPWSQLTSLTLSRMFPDECTQVLQRTPYLVHCSLALMDEGQVDAGAQVSLSHLRSLTMPEWEEDYPATGYLETFVVPALSRLEVPESFLGVDPIGCLRSFIQNSGCKLQNVVITGDDVAFINSYQSAFPSIPNFSFRRYHEDESYTDLLPGNDP
ncbi:hypothetical protein C8R46DRAFT_30773 [Mycena filopes]|nr:hypothetical protein C8R46DRAFT_30773 [Mycena filopes]